MIVPTQKQRRGTGLKTSLYRSYPLLPVAPVYSLGTDPIRIGRNSACEIFLQDHAASRVHAQIEEDRDSFILIDQRSTNGSFVNGIRVNESRLSHGDVIFLGNSVFRVINHEGDQDLERQISYLRATRDSITNTHTMDYFLEQLSRELAIVQRTSRNLSLMICSPLRDLSTELPAQMAQEIATRFNSVLRADTCVTRISDPDRFAIFLPSCNESGARAASERLTEITESKMFALSTAESQSVSLSITSSTTPVRASMTAAAVVNSLVTLSTTKKYMSPGFHSLPMTELNPSRNAASIKRTMNEIARGTWLPVAIDSETKLDL